MASDIEPEKPPVPPDQGEGEPEALDEVDED